MPVAAAGERSQGVLFAATAGAPRPDGAVQIATLRGIRFFKVNAQSGISAPRYAAALNARRGISGAQADTPIAGASIAGTCVDAPTAHRQGIPSITNARGRQLPKSTRPVAVLDTGVDAGVPELAGRVLPVSSAVEAPSSLADDDGHGTQAASAAAAAPGLVAGVSPTSPVMPIRIAATSQLATTASIVKGLELAVQRRARVAILPFSQPLTQTPQDGVTAVGLAVNAAFDSGVIVVAPAGNEGRGDRIFPGGLSHLLTVGSSGALAVRDPFSNYGPWIDLVAPGSDLVLPAPTAICPTGYAAASGTSFSAAAAGGAVALIAAARPSLSTPQLYDLVRREATTDGGLRGFDDDTGFGLLNVQAGLTAPVPRRDPHELNDNVHWLKRRPAAFPTYLKRTRRTTTRGSLAPAKDPQDAFKIALNRNDVLRVRVKASDPAALLYASIWSRRTGPFDMRLPAPSTELRNGGGFTRNPTVSYRATRAGTYYAAIFAPDLRVPDDPDEPRTGLLTNAPPHMDYSVTFDKRCSSSRRLRVPLERLRRRGATMNSLTVYVDSIPWVRRERAAIERRLTLRGLRRGRHRIVYRATFAAHRRTSSATRIRVRCTLKLARR
jgi:hypothetical protein